MRPKYTLKRVHSIAQFVPTLTPTQHATWQPQSADTHRECARVSPVSVSLLFKTFCILAGGQFLKSSTLPPLTRKRDAKRFVGGNSVRMHLGAGLEVEFYGCTNHAKVCKLCHNQRTSGQQKLGGLYLRGVVRRFYIRSSNERLMPKRVKSGVCVLSSKFHGYNKGTYAGLGGAVPLTFQIPTKTGGPIAYSLRSSAVQFRKMCIHTRFMQY